MMILTAQTHYFSDQIFSGYVICGISLSALAAAFLFLVNDLVEKNFNWRKRYIAVIIFGSIMTWSGFKLIEQNRSLLRNKTFTIGFTKRYVSGKQGSIEYYYFVDHKRYVCSSGYYPLKLHSIVIPKGKYLVLYDASSPQNSEMDFRYLIRDSADFIKFSKSYKNY